MSKQENKKAGSNKEALKLKEPLWKKK